MPRPKRNEIIYAPPRKIPGKRCLYITWSEGGRSKRLSTGTADEAEAFRYYYQFLAGINAPLPPQTVYLKDALAEYEKGHGQRTRNPKKIVTRSTKLLEFFKDIPVLQITRSQCLAYADLRRKEGVGNSTIRRELGIMSAAINWVRKEGWIPFAPHIDRPTDDKSTRKAMTKEQARALVAACVENHVKTFIILGLTTGARKEAITELTWDRVDFHNRTIDFSLTEAERQEFGHNHRMKGRGFVRMNNLAYGQLLIAKELSQTKYVIEYGGKRVTTMTKAFNATRERANLPDWITPHVMRHTAATLSLSAGSDPYEVAGMLGHENVNTTILQYGHHHPDYQKKTAATLEDVG